MLQIAIEQDDGVAVRCLKARGQCGLLAEVTRQRDAAKPFEFAPCRYHRSGVVGAAIVDHDDFPAQSRGPQDLFEAGQQHAQIGCLVEAWDNT